LENSVVSSSNTDSMYHSTLFNLLKSEFLLRICGETHYERVK